MLYPYTITKEDGAYVVSFPDFPEAHTFGDTIVEAKGRALDALRTVIDAYIDDAQVIPAPSLGGVYFVELPVAEELRVRHYQEASETWRDS